MALDKARLIAWLTDRAAVQAPIVHAVYAGLADRIRRGEFDEGGGDGGTRSDAESEHAHVGEGQ